MEDAGEYMESGDEGAVYWYQLAQALEPDDPD